MASLGFPLLSLALLLCSTARAQGTTTPGGPDFLPAAEVRAALVDQPVTGSRGVYGALAQIHFHGDGTVDIVNVDTSKARKGRWVLQADGQMCITWPTVAAPSCYVYARQGTKLVAYEAGDRRTPHAELQRKRTD